VIYLLVLAFVIPWLAPLLPYWFHTCPSQYLLKLPCPFCGLTRALAALAQGHVGTALNQTPVALPFVLLLASELVFRAVGASGRLPACRIQRIVRADAACHAAFATGYVASLAWWYDTLC